MTNIAAEQIRPLPVTAYTTVCAAGTGKEKLLAAIRRLTPCLAPLKLFDINFDTFVGEYPDQLPNIRPELASFSTRNAKLALAAAEQDGFRQAVEQAILQYGANRIGIVLGTSTSGMFETELAYQTLERDGHMPASFDFMHQHIWQASTRFLQLELGLQGPSYTISTACSSSSKSIACGQRLIESGVCDAVIAGGVDSLCHLTLHGFNALELTSPEPCTPLDATRRGISLGEGAGLVLLEKPTSAHADKPHLLGAGESSDAHHMTAPHPEGDGSKLAMELALKQSGLKADDIGYINLHATGTPLNDASEMKAIERVFGDRVPCSGTKGLTGHTLGAAGGIEAVIALLALEHAILPGTCSLKTVDPAFHAHIIRDTTDAPNLRRVMSNNFGFGGNNSSLIFGLPNA